MPKKIIINRKVKRTRKKILIGSIILVTGLCILLIVGIWIVIARIRIVSPVSLTVNNKKVYFLDNHSEEQKVSEMLDNYHIEFAQVTAGHDIITVQLKDESEVLLSPDKNLDNQIASLQLLMDNFTIEGKAIKRIDLRFNQPVVVFDK